ncbi:hypothetical protein BST22_16700 [Mycolicibacterium chubuense]|jgi:hypothetical protein|uniref:DUF3060 domain-containing protein n=1 Tax=Mycolicibacterium chubuense TaxID=1800 RepID=A0A0J6WSP9_MYCCU|nr:DUF3060 domain-containing protein [Mycolicibacterium chubuense]KMO84812.1 hypothetical protein MCHUDSM44219_00264 [Mycolicibacterium chubuense]ORA49724.1 hypothetical protein BST22_16700 [Mycolicibacterium chubuense]SPY00024.1 Protein of uncharacterised function (DUF3060) [Mycolicibacterium chubuense]
MLGACVLTMSAVLTLSPPAQAKNGDTHITGQGVSRTIDCNNATLIVVGTGNQITAVGTCWAVTVQGSSNVIVADNVINDVTVYGYDQTVFYKNGAPIVWDRGRELGMTNRIDRVPA